MSRRKFPTGDLESLIATGKDMFNSRLSSMSKPSVLGATRFKGKLGATIAVITALVVGFLTVPNNILYFIDYRQSPRWSCEDRAAEKGKGVRPDYEYSYIYAGITLIMVGCFSMVVSIVLSYFVVKSTRKMSLTEDGGSVGTVLTCLVMMNVELFLAIVAGCMELLYRPLTTNAHRLHSVECAIAVFNILIYIMYVVTMVLTSSVLRAKGKSEGFEELACTVTSSIPSARNCISSRGNPFNTQSSFVM